MRIEKIRHFVGGVRVICPILLRGERKSAYELLWLLVMTSKPIYSYLEWTIDSNGKTIRVRSQNFRDTRNPFKRISALICKMNPKLNFEKLRNVLASPSESKCRYRYPAVRNHG